MTVGDTPFVQVLFNSLFYTCSCKAVPSLYQTGWKRYHPSHRRVSKRLPKALGEGILREEEGEVLLQRREVSLRELWGLPHRRRRQQLCHQGRVCRKVPVRLPLRAGWKRGNPSHRRLPITVY